MELSCLASIRDPRELKPGFVVLGQVYDYQGKAQGQAAFAVASSIEGQGHSLQAWFLRCTDGYFKWWAMRQAGPQGLGRPLSLLLGTQNHVEQSLEQVYMNKYVLLDLYKVASTAGSEKFSGWDQYAMRVARSRAKRAVDMAEVKSAAQQEAEHQEYGDIPALQAALGGAAAPDEMLSKEELEQKLREASWTGKREREAKSSLSERLGDDLATKAQNTRAGAIMAVKSKGPRLQTLLQQALPIGRGDREAETGGTESEIELDIEQNPAKVAKHSPGKLTHCHRYLTELHRQTRGSLGLGRESEDLMPRVASFYLSTVLARRFPSMQSNLRTWKEAATLAEIVDAIVTGHSLQAADLAVQRLKALEIASVQGSWSQARWLELVDSEQMGA
eukprot:4426201-Amphidinium_carterae.1